MQMPPGLPVRHQRSPATLTPPFVKKGASLIVLMLTLATTRSPVSGIGDVERLIQFSEGLPRRLCEARLSGFPFAFWFGKEGPDAGPSRLRFRSLAGEILLKTPEDSPDSYYVRGLAALADGHTSGAITFFESCVSRSPRNSRCWCALAAARHEASRLNDLPELDAKALDAADRALAIDSYSTAATFNRAVILNALFLQTAAETEYRRYLQLDSSSGWANEVRTRLTALQRVDRAAAWRRATTTVETASEQDLRALVLAFPQQSRTSGEGEYLCRWADASLGHNKQEADRYLSVAGVFGVELLNHGEHLLYDSINSIRDAAARGNTNRIQAIARAYVEYRAGRSAYSDRRVGESIASLAKAEHDFAAVRHPMALSAEYFRANALYDFGDRLMSIRLLDDISIRIPNTYLALRAQILWERAYILSRSGGLHDALSARMEALRLFEQLGERENATAMRSSMADILSVLGRTHEAWSLRRRVFAEASQSGDPATLEGALNTAARDSMRDGEWGVARSLLQVALLTPLTSARRRTDVFEHLAEVEFHESSHSNLTPLRANALSISDPALRADALDDLRLTEAVMLRESNPRRSIALLTDTIRFRTIRSRTLWLAPAYIERARANAKLGRVQEARGDLQLAINNIEEQRNAIHQPGLRDSFLDTMQAAFLALIDLDISIGDFADGFRRSDEMRTYDEIIGHTSTPALGPNDVAARLPLGALLIEHVALDDRLITMTITRLGLHTYVTHVGRVRLREQIDRFRNAIAANDRKSIDAESKTMFDALIGPNSLELLPDVRTVIVIPDTTTGAVPFAALRNNKNGRYLIEDVSIATASSARAFFTPQAAKPINEPRALVVGDPAVDRNEFPRLEPLPAAASEARTVAAMYNTSALIGLHASKDHVLSEMTVSDIIHIAGHASANPHNPDSGFLPLAASGRGSNILYLSEISKLRLARNPIVILAGCRTASESAGYGLARSFATAFLAAGSRSVIASLWEVNDMTTGVFSTLIHSELRAHHYATSTALRNTQLVMLHSTSPATSAPRAWSGFQALAYSDAINGIGDRL